MEAVEGEGAVNRSTVVRVLVAALGAGAVVASAPSCKDDVVAPAAPVVDAGRDGRADPDGEGACTSGQVRCAEGCVDALTSARHCGACDHGCGGGTCREGECQPLTLVRGLNSATAFGQDAQNLYVLGAGTHNPDRRVLRISKDGASPCDGDEPRCTVAVPAGFVDAGIVGPQLESLAVAPQGLLVGLSGAGVALYNAQTSTWEMLLSRRAPTHEMLAIGSEVYVATDSEDYLERLDLTTRDLRTMARGDGGAPVLRGLVEDPDGGHLLFNAITELGGLSLGIHRAPKGGPICVGNQCLVSEGITSTFTRAGGWLYAVRDDVGKRRIERFRGDGTCDGASPCPQPVVLGITNSSVVLPMTVDTSHVYWSEKAGAEGAYQVRRLPLSATPCVESGASLCGQVLFEGVQQVGGLVVDDAFAYALVVEKTSLQFQVWKRAKPVSP